MRQPELAIIGGTGVYDMQLVRDAKAFDVATPFGQPSDSIYVGDLMGLPVAFLARHGQGHRLLPHEVPYRANIWALKELGVRQIVSISACGSLREDFAPGDIVIPDQLFDRTHSRPATFFGDGVVAHISLAEPFCCELSDILCQCASDAGGTVHAGGTYLIIQGPRFSTRGESLTYRQWGMDIIGMTAVPEAQLAREAEMCYALMAHVTDYDCWRETEEAVSVELVTKTLAQNAEVARRTIVKLAQTLASRRSSQHCPCGDALQNALLTPPDRISQSAKEQLAPILRRYLAVRG